MWCSPFANYCFQMGVTVMLLNKVVSYGSKAKKVDRHLIHNLALESIVQKFKYYCLISKLSKKL